jgi:uncharacterized membrane protein YccC
MTQHNFYEAYFYTEADWAQTMIKAKTPEQALQRARKIESEETETLNFQSHDSGAGVEHIEIQSADGSTVAEWRSEDLRVRLSARDLLEALESQTDAAQAVIDNWSEGDLAAAVRSLDEAIEAARAAIAKAKLPTA